MRAGRGGAAVNADDVPVANASRRSASSPSPSVTGWLALVLTKGATQPQSPINACAADAHLSRFFPTLPRSFRTDGADLSDASVPKPSLYPNPASFPTTVGDAKPSLYAKPLLYTKPTLSMAVVDLKLANVLFW
jgi:hypothetical protein